MKITWIGKGENGDGGDYVFDRMMIASLRALGHQIDVVVPRQLDKITELLLLAKGVPYYRARYLCSDNIILVHETSKNSDVTIISWEPFDIFVTAVIGQVILIAHNITSDSLQSIFPHRSLINVIASRCAVFEREIYRSPKLLALAVLSTRDKRLISSLNLSVPCTILYPGMPETVALSDQASLRQELVLFGTYKWLPKHRDLVAFAKNYKRQNFSFPILSDRPLPKKVRRYISVRPFQPVRTSPAALRFGLVTDRFISGFKLKVGEYISECCVVISFVDLLEDFVGISDAELFIRNIKSESEIGTIMENFSQFPSGELAKRFRAFQTACAARFRWSRSACLLHEIAIDQHESKNTADCIHSIAHPVIIPHVLGHG